MSRVVATTADLDAEKERQISMMGEGARAQIERASSKSVAWTVFSAEGTMRATVPLPTALEVYEVGRDYVLGRYVDADESVPEVRLYAVTRK